MNREWHDQHRLSTGASLEERVQWHIEHAETCACRPVPRSVLEELERRRLEAEEVE